ncbi:MAG: hypothetical protein ACQEUC_07780 [Pseudomonadota bacterium]
MDPKIEDEGLEVVRSRPGRQSRRIFIQRLRRPLLPRTQPSGKDE